MSWRAEDQALLDRLLDERLLGELWAETVPTGAPPPHPRASGMLASFRSSASGKEAVERARTGDRAALRRLLLPRAADEMAPALLHHLALYHGAVADALAEVDPPRSVDARLHALTAWLALGAEGSYVRTLAHAVVDDALPAPDVERAAAEAPLICIDDLGETALSGARDRTLAARTALRALSRVREAVDRAHPPTALATAAMRRAGTATARAVAEALAPLSSRLADASARGVAAAGRAAIIREAVDVWHFAGQHEDVERFAIDMTTPLAWELYRDRRWDELRRALEPLLPLVESMAARLTADPFGVAYAAPCAQIFVFLADVQRTLARQIDVCERAVALCPIHRNGRVVLAELLCERAIEIVETGWPTAERIARARRDLARAEELYPSARRLPRARERVARAAGRTR